MSIFLYLPVILPNLKPLLLRDFPAKPAASAPRENPMTCKDPAGIPLSFKNSIKSASCCPIYLAFRTADIYLKRIKETNIIMTEQFVTIFSVYFLLETEFVFVISYYTY